MSAENSGGFLGLDEEWSSPDRSGVVILPIPYELTTSYGKGTASAPRSIIEASSYLELYDEELDAEICKLSNGIATMPPLEFDNKRDDEAVDLIREHVMSLIKQNRRVVCIGGEHTIAVGAAQAHAGHYQELSVLQFDAHSDLRNAYEGSRYSHASAMARIHDFHPAIVEVGIRSQCVEEAEFIKNNKLDVFYAVDLKRGKYGPDAASWADAVIERLEKNVYVTFDCDFLDPSIMPAVGTPEPGGFGWDETMVFLRVLASRRNVVGFDINELAPIPGLLHPQFTIAKLIYKFLGYSLLRR
jgi:agmatinase